jgi:lactoylglutathione lyase
MFTRIAHVCLHVQDLARSIEYYAKLGFVTKFRFTRQGAPFGAYLEIAEGSYVEVFEDRTRGEAKDAGIVHFCLETDDIDRVVAELRQRGVTCTEKKLGCDQTYQIWLTDPDGNRFEVHQYTGASTQRLGGVVEADW